MRNGMEPADTMCSYKTGVNLKQPASYCSGAFYKNLPTFILVLYSYLAYMWCMNVYYWVHYILIWQNSVVAAVSWDRKMQLMQSGNFSLELIIPVTILVVVPLHNQQENHFIWIKFYKLLICGFLLKIYLNQTICKLILWGPGFSKILVLVHSALLYNLIGDLHFTL